MELNLLVLVFLIKGLWTEAVRVTGKLHSEVTVTCSHSNAATNIKYFCKGACRNKDVLVTTRTPKSKYIMKDEGNIFYVTISDLTLNDSGLYWCGVERIGLDTFTRIDLTVELGNTEKGNQIDVASKMLVVSVVVGLVVFSLLIILLMLVRRRRIRTSSGKNHDAIASSQNKQKHRLTTSSSTANQDTGTDVRSKNIYQHQYTSRGHSNMVNSNVSHSPVVLSQPEELLYTSVNFNTPTESSYVPPPSDAVIYSSVAAGERVHGETT